MFLGYIAKSPESQSSACTAAVGPVYTSVINTQNKTADKLLT